MDTGTLGAFASQFGISPLILMGMIAWVLFWKGLALWKAAGLRQKYWFIALLLINTLGLLEIIYIFFVAKNYKLEVVEN